MMFSAAVYARESGLCAVVFVVVFGAVVESLVLALVFAVPASSVLCDCCCC